MSKFGEQIDGNDSICPYCGDSFQVEAEDYDEDPREIECDSCGKKYWLRQTFEVTHTATPDCELNGDKHWWIGGAVGQHTLIRWDCCDICGKIVRIAPRG